MNYIAKYIFGIGLFLIMQQFSMAQDRFEKLANELEILKVDAPGLENKVDLSVTDVSLEEFIRGIAKANDLNISVEPGLEVTVVNNFSDATVADVLIFLAKKNDLEVSFVGNIISISPYVPPVVEQPKVIEPEMDIRYNSATDILSLDLKRHNMLQVSRKITEITPYNIILSPGMEAISLNAYIQEMSFEQAMFMLGYANGFSVEFEDDSTVLISKEEVAEAKPDPNSANKRRPGNRRGQIVPSNSIDGFELYGKNPESFSLRATNYPLSDLIKGLSDSLEVNYYLNSDITGNTTINIENTAYNKVLDYVFSSTDYTYKVVDGIYIIGKRVNETLRTTKVLQLQHRTIEKVVEYIPKELSQNVDIKEFPELNSLILSGSEPNILEMELFLRDIDKVVPLILIEVILVDYQMSRQVNTGVKANLGGENVPESSGGSVFPTVDYTLNSESINNLISSFNGSGLVNLGRVSPNFYVQINALESQGILKVRSTPKLATLNGNEASLSIGSTEYYLIQSQNVIGTQNPSTTFTQQYKPVNADLSVTIKPMVSGDDQITLDITVTQSDFTSKISETAPPGTTTRSFSSLLRIRNEEMVLLGGLEEKTIDKSGSGVPFLSRIPVIKWLFSNRSDLKSKSKLNIFIKPTVIY